MCKVMVIVGMLFTVALSFCIITPVDEECVKQIEKENEEKAKIKPTLEESQDYTAVPLVGRYEIVMPDIKEDENKKKVDMF